MVPLDQLVSAEVVPYHMHQIKEHLVSLAEGTRSLAKLGLGLTGIEFS